MYQLHTLDGVAYEFVSLTKIWTLWVSTNDNSANSYLNNIEIFPFCGHLGPGFVCKRLLCVPSNQKITFKNSLFLLGR